MAKIEIGQGRWVDFPLESPRGVSAESARLFDEVADAIKQEWRLRSASPKRDLNWLKRTCYVVITEMLVLDIDELFKARSRSHGRYARGEKGRPNIFQVGLMAIFAEDRRALNARDRERFGKQLRCAYQHYVPPDFLIGFLWQIGGDQGSQGTRTIRKDFYEWIIEQRLMDDQDERGPYPRVLEAAFDKRRAKQAIEDDW